MCRSATCAPPGRSLPTRPQRSRRPTRSKRALQPVRTISGSLRSLLAGECLPLEFPCYEAWGRRMPAGGGLTFGSAACNSKVLGGNACRLPKFFRVRPACTASCTNPRPGKHGRSDSAQIHIRWLARISYAQQQEQPHRRPTVREMHLNDENPSSALSFAEWKYHSSC